MTSESERHLSVESFARYLKAGVPINHPIPGNPRLVLFFEPDAGRVGLLGPAAVGEKPDRSGLENVEVHTVQHQRQRMIRIAVTDDRTFLDAYPVLCAVADRVQMDHQTLTVALSETLQRLGHLLQPEEIPSQEIETGLLGELRILAGLARAVGPAQALQSWRGGQREEHDFGLPEHDIEVKTTTSEARSHWITSLTQLVPTGDRPLWLVSVQVTGAGTGGVTLSEAVSRVRNLFTTASVTGFDVRLQAAGWRSSYAARCFRRWRLRTEPAVFQVTTDFPRLTRDLLLESGVGTGEVIDVRYRIDLTNRVPDRCPGVLAETITAGRQELP